MLVCVTGVGVPTLTVTVTPGAPPTQTVDGGGVLIAKCQHELLHRGKVKTYMVAVVVRSTVVPSSQ